MAALNLSEGVAEKFDLILAKICSLDSKMEDLNTTVKSLQSKLHTTFIAEIARRNWNFLQSKERLAPIFNKPPLVVHRRPIRLLDRLVSTKFKCSWCKEINMTTTFTSSNIGNCEEELPKKPVGRLSVNCRPTVYRQLTNRLPTG